jgi:hypothetical protein
MAVYNHTLGTDPVWVANYRVTCPGVHVKTHDGYIRLAFRGACLDWLSPTQESHLLGLGLVERIPADEQAAIDAAAPVVTADLDEDADEDEYAPAPEQSGGVDECLAAMAHLQVPATAGAPTARTALRDAGHRFGNDVIAHAVKRRKSSLSGTTTEDDDDAFECVKF